MVLHTGIAIAPLLWLWLWLLLDCEGGGWFCRRGVSVITIAVLTNGNVLCCIIGIVAAADDDDDDEDGLVDRRDRDCDDCCCGCETSLCFSVYKGITGKWWLPMIDRLRPNRTPGTQSGS